MKSSLSFILFFLTTTAFSQNKFESFNAKKKTMSLRTGIHMKYIDVGSAKGKTVLLLHGLTDTSRSFELLIEELSRMNKDLRIIAPDLRGHGETSMPDPATCHAKPELCFQQQQFTADLVDLIDQLKLKQVVLVGHSLGSTIAQTFAISYPERVEKLVLIGTFVDASKCAAVPLVNEWIEGWGSVLKKRPNFNWPMDAYLLPTEDLGEEVKVFLRDNWVSEPCADPAFLKAIYPETISVRMGTWIGVVRALATFKSTELQKLKAPTLILWATQDAFMIYSDQDLVKEEFSKAWKANQTPVVFKTYGKLPLPESGPLTEIGHNTHWAAPHQVADDINTFILYGKPTDTRPFSDPDHPQEILTEQMPSVVQQLK